ncbi:MAG: zinc-ribbon domain-containing protein [Nitrososphaerota archaeon]|nr:zinc-ribbon domain-containing protein [Nitrososphaerota archaeon]
MYCRYCGAENNTNAIYCKRCGQSIKTAL